MLPLQDLCPCCFLCLENSSSRYAVFPESYELASSSPLISLKCHLLSGDFSHALFKIAIHPAKSWSLSLHSTYYHLTYYMFNFFICSLCLKRKYKLIERRYLCLFGSLLCSSHLEKYLALINIGKWINKWPPPKKNRFLKHLKFSHMQEFCIHYWLCPSQTKDLFSFLKYIFRWMLLLHSQFKNSLTMNQY